MRGWPVSLPTRFAAMAKRGVSSPRVGRPAVECGAGRDGPMAAGAGVRRKRAAASAAPGSAEPLLLAIGTARRHGTDAGGRQAGDRPRAARGCRAGCARTRFVRDFTRAAVSGGRGHRSIELPCRAAGHVVYLSTGAQIYALSTLGARRPKRDTGRFGLATTPGKNEPRVLWKQDIIEPTPAEEFRFVERSNENRQQLTTAWGEIRYYPWGARWAADRVAFERHASRGLFPAGRRVGVCRSAERDDAVGDQERARGLRLVGRRDASLRRAPEPSRSAGVSRG